MQLRDWRDHASTSIKHTFWHEFVDGIKRCIQTTEVLFRSCFACPARCIRCHPSQQFNVTRQATMSWRSKTSKVEKMSIFDMFQRRSSKETDKQEKKHQSSNSTEETPGGPTRRTWPIEDRNTEPIRRVTPTKPASQRASHDEVARLREQVENMGANTRPSPQGPRKLPRTDSEKSDTRAPYEPKYFSRSDSTPSIRATSPLKNESFPRPQGWRSISQTTSADSVVQRKSGQEERPQFPPRIDSRTDSRVKELRKKYSQGDKMATSNHPLSPASQLYEGAEHAPPVPRKNSAIPSMYGEVFQATPYIDTPITEKERSSKRSSRSQFRDAFGIANDAQKKYATSFEDPKKKDDTCKSIGSEANSASFRDSMSSPGKQGSRGLGRWGTFCGPDSPKAVSPLRFGSFNQSPKRPKEYVRNTNRFGTPEKAHSRAKYGGLSPAKNEARKYREASHARKASIEVVRRAQEEQKLYGIRRVSEQPNQQRSPSKIRSPSYAKRRPSASTRKHDVLALGRMQARQGSGQVPSYRPQVSNHPGDDVPSPFLRADEKAKQNTPNPLIKRKPILAPKDPRRQDDDETENRRPEAHEASYADGYRLKPVTYGTPASPDILADALASANLSPIKPIRRKTLKGPSFSDLARQREKQYRELVESNPFGNTTSDGEVKQESPRRSLPRSYAEHNLGIKAISTPTYEDIASEPFEFSELVPRPLNLGMEPAPLSLKGKKSTLASKSSFDAPPPLRSSKTQDPPTMNKYGVWNYGKRTQSDNFENFTGKQSTDSMMKEIHDEIDAQLDSLLENRKQDQAKAAEKEAEREREKARRAVSKNHWEEMRAKLRVDSTYSELDQVYRRR